MLDILHFQGNHMPDGAESIAGEKLTLENVSPKHAGTYTCTAANGNGSPVSNRITVNIEYKPIVELEEDKKRIKIHNFGSKYSLSINSVEREDYGSYSCHASNSLGSTTAVQEISGKIRKRANNMLSTT